MSDISLKLENISKSYKLYSNHFDQLIDVMGLDSIGLKPRQTPIQKFALNKVSLEVKKGERVGLIGKNGAGKSTLLKLVCGNLKPTSGAITVSGNVQALLTQGIGFNPEMTGRENTIASLQYNGISRDDYDHALNDVIDFCELGDYFDQAFKSYSSGMQARLMFAVATAIRPEIIIIDEVLGAGDAYFIAKSKRRMEQLLQDECTMLLVSHSMSQVLELCDRCIWVHDGEVLLDGDSFEVVKFYEEYMNNRIQANPDELKSKFLLSRQSALQKNSKLENSKDEVVEKAQAPEKIKIQQKDITFSKNISEMPVKERYKKDFPMNIVKDEQGSIGYNHIARGGVTSWEDGKEVKITGFDIYNSQGRTDKIQQLNPAKFLIEVTAQEAGYFNLRYALVIYDHSGQLKLRLFSVQDSIVLEKGQRRVSEVFLDALLLGEGEYTISLSLHDYDEIEKINSTKRYDLLSRSFQFKVIIANSLAPISAQFAHPTYWNFYN